MRLSRVNTLIIQLAIWAVAGLSVFGLVWRYYPAQGRELISLMSCAILISQLVLQPGLYWRVGQKRVPQALVLGVILAVSMWLLHAVIMVGIFLLLGLLYSNFLGWHAVLTDRVLYIILVAVSAAIFIWLYPKIDRSLMLDQTAPVQRPAASLTILLANFGAYILALIFIWLAIGWVGPVEFRGW